MLEGLLYFSHFVTLVLCVINCRLTAFLFVVVLYRVQLFRVRVEYESGGVEYGPSTSLEVSSTVQVRVWRCRVRSKYESASLSGFTHKNTSSSPILLQRF